MDRYKVIGWLSALYINLRQLKIDVLNSAKANDIPSEIARPYINRLYLIEEDVRKLRDILKTRTRRETKNSEAVSETVEERDDNPRDNPPN